MGRPVVHWELMSKDPAKVAAFYEKIFGWKIQHMPEMDYRLVETGGAGGINGGILKPQRPEPWPGNMTFYIHVEDQEVPGMGAFTLFTDPEGRMMGLWKTAKK